MESAFNGDSSWGAVGEKGWGQIMKDFYNQAGEFEFDPSGHGNCIAERKACSPQPSAACPLSVPAGLGLLGAAGSFFVLLAN